MDRYKEIAKEFFENFESKQHYPRLFSRALILWILAVIYAFMSWVRADSHSLNMYFLFPAMLLAVCASGVVSNHKNNSVNKKFEAYPCIDAARISEIERLLGKDRSEFHSAAQNLMQLIELSKQCGRQPLSTRDIFPIPWAKGQFVMHALALAALLATTLGVLFPDAAKEMGEHIAKDYMGHFIIGIFFAIFLGLTAFPMSRSMWHNFKLVLAMWQARLQRGPVSSRVHLDYLLANLVRLHDPSPAGTRLSPKTVRRLPPNSRRNL